MKTIGSEHPRARPATPGTTYREMDLLRFSTAGSVDDGKSTLIGRLLYDTKSIFQDQLEAVGRTSKQRGEGYVNLALLTDGLRAEREQNITIDVAYRYFATPKRKFIIADTPGHIQYTRNMVTGASTAELAIILVDARKGVVTQSKRHSYIASLLRIPHIVVAVNKMDLVDYSEEVYEQIVDEYRDFAAKLDVQDLTFIPMSALIGDNIVEKSERMPWYGGSTLLHHLETVNIGSNHNLVDLRFPVQYVIRPHQDYRGFAGRVASGSLRPGDEVIALPSRRSSRIRSIDTSEGALQEAAAGASVILTLEDEIDVSRGDMLVCRRNFPIVGDRFRAILCWMGERPLDCTVPYLLMQTTRQTQAFVIELVHRVDADTLHREEVDTLELNDIGRVEISTSQPMFVDAYAQNRTTGSFILVDPHIHVTVAAGMILDASGGAPTVEKERVISPNVVWADWNIPRARREARNGHKAAVLWFTGLSGAGKSTIARAVEHSLFELGCQTMLLDGDQVRHGLCGDLGFRAEDRTENVRRAGEVSRLFFEQGSIVLCTFVSPIQAYRNRVRELFPDGRFFEIHVHADLETLQKRDPKRLYARALAGEVQNLTGLQAPYEEPVRPEIRIDTQSQSVDQSVAMLLRRLKRERILAVHTSASEANGA